jgi:adenylate cyclase
VAAVIEFANLPDRVIQRFCDLQYRSELLVASLQLAIITALFAIFLLSPVGYSPDAPIHSALLGLSLFTILVLVRLWFAYSKQLNPIFLGISVVTEMGLLLFIIWTYYLQFESTPNINLKNSHINYVFLLIALRALRFEPIWVILSGATATIGWSLIVLHALNTNMEAITWDYVTYASTRSIYLGAEFDKILTILLVTIVLAIVLKRAKETLEQAVSETFKAEDLSYFFDSALVDKITHSNMKLAPGEVETRNAVIMFIDLRGFSKLSEKIPPKELIGILGEYQKLLVPIVQTHAGTIDKFMGDGILASFGAAIPSTTYARDALNAVDSIIKAIKQWQAAQKEKGISSLDVGMGLAIGEVLFGIIGDNKRLEYTVIGETVNIAAKLEKQNKIENVRALATYAVIKVAKEQGYDSPIEREIRYQREVGGIDGKLDLVVLA